MSHPGRIRNGKVMRTVSSYLERQAGNSKYPTDPSGYASLGQIADDLDLKHDIACDSLGILIRNGEVRIYPSGTKYRRLYGSRVLPKITSEDVLHEIMA